MSKVTFKTRLYDLGEEAIKSIKDFMADKEQWWEPDFDGQAENHDIGEHWISFDNIMGDGQWLVGITNLPGEGIIIYSLSFDEHESNEDDLSSLSAEAYCYIADYLNTLTK